MAPPSPSPSTKPSDSFKKVWTPEEIDEEMERSRVQDEASARIRRALGRVVTPPRNYIVTPPQDTPSSPEEEG